MRPAHETCDMLFFVEWRHCECPSDPTSMGRFCLKVEIEDKNIKMSKEFHISTCVTNVAQMVWDAVMEGKLPDPDPEMLLEPEGEDLKSRLCIVKAGDRSVVGSIFEGIATFPKWQNEGSRIDVLTEALFEYNNFI